MMAIERERKNSNAHVWMNKYKNRQKILHPPIHTQPQDNAHKNLPNGKLNNIAQKKMILIKKNMRTY